MDVVVTGIGLVSALGSLENSWERLLAGESGIEQHQPFLELEPRPLALIDPKPADLITLIRRVLADALLDADLTLPLSDCGIAIGSSRGFQANLEQLLREEPPPVPPKGGSQKNLLLPPPRGEVRRTPPKGGSQKNPPCPPQGGMEEEPPPAPPKGGKKEMPDARCPILNL